MARANREEHARLLAEKCRDDAAKVGISRWALEIVAGGDLISRMIQALNEAEFRQMCAISWRTGKAIRQSAAHSGAPRFTKPGGATLLGLGKHHYRLFAVRCDLPRHLPPEAIGLAVSRSIKGAGKVVFRAGEPGEAF